MSTDLRARLDDAIKMARLLVMHPSPEPGWHADALDRYGDLRELRARWDELIRAGEECDISTPYAGCCYGHDRGTEIEADVRRLLPGDGPTEAHSARNDDQSSG